MALRSYRSPCFILAGYRLADDTLWLWFTDGSRYCYPDSTFEQFTALEDASRPGLLFNTDLRRTDDDYVQHFGWPCDLDYIFSGHRYPLERVDHDQPEE